MFENKLLNDNIKFIYFPSPSNKFEYLNILNFSTTVWDLCHLQYKEFPEVYSYKEFDLREYHYNRVLKKSSFVITESEDLSDLICKSYNVERSNIISLPLSINGMLNKESSNIRKVSPDIPKNFFFYPAQFWPHKNHINILKAFQKVCSEYTEWYLIFCGSNTGNLDYLKKQTEILSLKENVIFEEYIKDEDMSFFYQNCSCVIMTTLFGPTNIPPLEAWYFNKPLIYSDHLSKNIEGAALFVNPLDKMSIRDAMLKVIRSDDDINHVLDNAKKMMEKLDLDRKRSYLNINNSIDKIRRISELYE